MARNLKMTLPGLTIHLMKSKGRGSKRVRTVLQQLTLLQGISAAGQLCLQQLYVFRFSKLRVFLREASQAKGSQKRFELEQELGHILTA